MTNGLGVNACELYVTENGDFVLLGDRFGNDQKKGELPTWKWGIGGAVDPEDKSMRDAYEREKGEEHFGQLISGFKTLETTSGTTSLAVGGIENKTDKKTGEDYLLAKGWGPNIGRVVEKEVSFAELEASLKIINDNCAMHFVVAEFFNDFDKLKNDGRKASAASLLSNFETYEGNKADITPLHPIVQSYLTLLSYKDALGNTPIPFGMTAANFNKKFVHIYTEYKSFKLVPKGELIKMIEEDNARAPGIEEASRAVQEAEKALKAAKMGQELFSAESALRNHLLQILADRK